MASNLETYTQEHYAKLQEYRDEAGERLVIGRHNTCDETKKLLRQYLGYRGYRLELKTSLEELALLLLELDTKDAQEAVGLTSMVFKAVQ